MTGVYTTTLIISHLVHYFQSYAELQPNWSFGHLTKLSFLLQDISHNLSYSSNSNVGTTLKFKWAIRMALNINNCCNPQNLKKLRIPNLWSELVWYFFCLHSDWYTCCLIQILKKKKLKDIDNYNIYIYIFPRLSFCKFTRKSFIYIYT